MMRKAAILAASVLALAAAGCTRGDRDEGPRVQRDFQVGAFQGIALGGSHQVIVHVGAAPSVRAEGSERTLDRLDIQVTDGSLHIGSRGRHWFGSRSSAVIHVTVPSLASVEVGGSGDINLGGLEVRDATISVAGSGDVVARATGTAQVSLAGSGDVAVTGPARCQIEKHGSGSVQCGGQSA